MRIVVLLKDVPDTYGDRVLDLRTGLAERGASDAVLDEIDGRALEQALTVADADPGVEVVVLSMGPAFSSATLRKGLAMGAAAAVHVVDDRLRGADALLTARVLSAVLTRVGFDLVVAGNASTDGVGGVIPSMIAEMLDLPSATNLNRVEVGAVTVDGERATENGTVRVTADLPALISITESFPEPRFPTFKGIATAKKKPIETLTLDDLGVQVDDAAAGSIVIAIAQRAPRAAGNRIIDSGDAGVQLAELLIERGLA